ncbi:N-hydroxyarylamine O-acetyltransferase [Virgisporangium aliadipatigenens]|uniref:N-hydroxyarylamine O-acetyltransferase n=1 Tax=Virgisporangium aliadipatigenens TaxID=741659 RepID=A0A8J4DUJ1_9ACTN|nr:arylamine N-acetyltransferase [Virgisporangium aliadipatigenens]GIJ50874.1 N-hydroxyarylamine O-acetyltransferase [Virgisporangium aliadipatigenens]
MRDELVAAYLDRLGTPRPERLDTAALRALHRAHQERIPFENLSIHLGESISLDPDDLVDKIVHRRRGGFCYELNGLFAQLLRALGARVDLHGARVYGAGTLSAPMAHLTLLVHTVEGGEPWVCDVGFGAHSTYPLRWAEPWVQEDPGGGFRLVNAGDDVDVVKDGEPQYRIERRPLELADCVPTCWWTATSPESHFTQGVICSRLTADGRISISGDRLIRTVDGVKTEETLADDAALMAAYRDHFGLELPRVPVRTDMPGDPAGR